MKAKKLTLFLATLLGATSLAACTDSDKTIDFNNYWQYNSLTTGETVNETLTYKVTFEKSAGVDSAGYTLSYGEGSYVATLETAANRTSYVYKTVLEIPVTYEYKGESKTFEDKITSEVTFLNASNGLRPVVSAKTVVCHTPTNAAEGSLESCFRAYDYTVVNEYAEGDTKTGKATVTYNDTEKTHTSSFAFGKSDYSHIDNEQLLLALRAVPTTTSTGKIEFYNPFLEANQRANFSFAEAKSGEFLHTVNGAPLSSKEISYRAVSLTLDSQNPGGTQTAWIATTETTDKNVHRNVMLYLETPLSYSMGVLKYTLVSVQNS